MYYSMAGTSGQKELLALIYQHLVQVGYKKAAKQLQQQSGQNIASSQSVSLLDIYTQWTKAPGKAKKRKANSTPKDLQTKKLRISDPASTSESSEEDEKDSKGQSIVKSVHGNSTAMSGSTEKVKNTASAGSIVNSTGSAKKVNAVLSKPGTPAKPASSKPIAPTKATGLAKQAVKTSESSDSSESEDERLALEPTPKPVVKPETRTAEGSSDTASSDDSEGEQVPGAQPKPTAKAALSKGLQVNAAAAKNIPSTPLSSKIVQRKVSSPAPSTKSAAAAPNQANAGTGKIMTPAKAAGIQKENSSDSSDSSDSEEEEAAQQAQPQQAKATPRKTSLAISASGKSAQGKASTLVSSTKPAATTPNQAKARIGKAMTPAKVAEIVTQPSESSSESGDDSDSEADMPKLKPTVKAVLSKTLQANATAAKNIPATPVTSKIAQGKVSSPALGTKSAVAKPNQARTGKDLTPAKAAEIQKGESSESSDDSDSEEEEVAQQAKAAPGKNSPAIPLSSKSAQGKVSTLISGTKLATATPHQAKAGTGKAATPAKAAEIVKHPAESSSDSSEDSESEEETQKFAVPAGKGTAAVRTAVAPAQKAQQNVSSSSSDSEEGQNPPARSPKVSAAALGGGKKAATPGVTTAQKNKKTDSSGETSSESDSEEDEKSRQKAESGKPVLSTTKKTLADSTPKKGTPIKSKGATPLPAKAVLNKVPGILAQHESSESSDDSESKDEDEVPAGKTPPRPGAAQKGIGALTQTKSVAKGADSSSEDSSDDELEPSQSRLAATALSIKTTKAAKPAPVKPQISKLTKAANATKLPGKVSGENGLDSESSVSDIETVKPASKLTPSSVSALSQKGKGTAQQIQASPQKLKPKKDSAKKKADDKCPLASKPKRKKATVSKSKTENNDPQYHEGAKGDMVAKSTPYSLLSLTEPTSNSSESDSDDKTTTVAKVKVPEAKRSVDDSDSSEEEEERKRKTPAAKAAKGAETPKIQTPGDKDSKKKKSAKKLKLASGDASTVTPKKSSKKKKAEKKKKKTKDKKKKAKKTASKNSASGVDTEASPSLKQKKKKKKLD